jgi:chaperonin GroES
MTPDTQAPDIESGMTDEQLGKLANEVYQDWEVDEEQFGDRRTAIKLSTEYAMQKTKTKDYPFNGASNVMYPLVAEACLSFLSQMKPALIVGDAPYKVMAADGVEEGAVQNEMAQAEDFLKAQFDTDWKLDLDRLLAYVPNVGMAFKKVYLEEQESAGAEDGTFIVNSEFVKIDDLSWSLCATSFGSIPRINHTFSLYPYQIDEYIGSGYFKEFEYSKSTMAGGGEDSQSPQEFIEQHRHDYVVTMHKETKKIVRVIDRKYNHFIPFGMIPSFDGELYYLGYGDLLVPINDTINTNTNMLQDAGNMSLGVFGLLGADARLQSGSNKLKPPFDLKKVNMTGKDIADSVYLFPQVQPNGVTFQLLDLFIQNGRTLANAVSGGDSMARSDMPAMTAMTIAEKSSTVLKGIFNSIVMSIQSEFNLILGYNFLILR